MLNFWYLYIKNSLGSALSYLKNVYYKLSSIFWSNIADLLDWVGSLSLSLHNYSKKKNVISFIKYLGKKPVYFIKNLNDAKSKRVTEGYLCTELSGGKSIICVPGVKDEFYTMDNSKFSTSKEEVLKYTLLEGSVFDLDIQEDSYSIKPTNKKGDELSLKYKI